MIPLREIRLGVNCIRGRAVSHAAAVTKTHRRLTKLEIQLLAQKLPVADLIADDNGYAAASAVTGDDLHPEDFARVVEEAFLIAEYRLEKLGAARDQARTPDVLLQRIVDKRRTDGT